MKQKVFLVLLALVVGVCLLNMEPLKATDFEGKEGQYNNICSGYITPDDENRAVCKEYQQYLITKSKEAKDNVAALNEEIAAIGDDLDAISAKSQQISAKIDSVKEEIAGIEANIQQIDASILQAQASIDAKEVQIDKTQKSIKKTKKNIKKRKGVIKERMVTLQIKANTNQYVNYIMGAENLVDMIQRATSIETFTSYDKNLIEELNVEIKKLKKVEKRLEKEKQELIEEQNEQERLKEQAKAEEATLESSKSHLEGLYTANEKLAGRYRSQQAALVAERNEAIRQSQIASGAASKIKFVSGSVSDSSGLLVPVSGHSSAGTWAYPGGGLHLGVDKSVSIGTAVYAPANGIVLSSNTAAGTSGGYLGNMIGYPYGGGNTLHILVKANGTTYAVSFFHLSPNIVSTGQQISQGQVIAYTGNTGNSSGPHCHIELFQLNCSFEEAVEYWNKNYDWAWGCGWSSPGTCSGIGCRVQPEGYGW